METHQSTQKNNEASAADSKKASSKALPAVSVIIPVCNAEDYIADAVQSVLDQSRSDLELIIVDDGSADDTVSRIEKFSDARIRLLKNPAGKGASYSINRALDIAEGKWITVLEADDWYAKDRLEQLVSTGNRDSLDMVADNIFMVPGDEKPETVPEYPRPPLHFSEDDILLDQFEYVTAVNFIRGNTPGEHDLRYDLIKPLFRRSFLELYRLKYPEYGLRSEEMAFYIICLSKGARMRVVRHAYYYHRAHPAQVSHAAFDNVLEHQSELSEKLIEDFREGHHQAIRRALQQRHESILREAYHHEIIRYVHAGSYMKALAGLVRRPSLLFRARTRRPVLTHLSGRARTASTGRPELITGKQLSRSTK